MEFRILGPLEVVEQGKTLPLGGGRQLALFVLLLLNANEVVSTDRLVDELWSDQPPSTAGKIVRNYVSLLRKQLGDRLVHRAPGYLLRVEAGELDSDRFDTLVREARVQPPAAAAATLRRALALWSGPPLSQFAYESFALSAIADLEERRLLALEDRIDADLELGRDREVVPELERLVREQPLRERPRSLLMLALYRAGRQAEALAVYQDARQTLVDELGLEPSPALQELQRRILAHDADLAPPRQARVAARRPKGGLVIALGGAVLLAAGIAAGILELTGSSTAGLSAVAPDSVGVIDPATGKIVAQIPVGSTPTRLAVGRAAVWVVNTEDETVSRIDPRTKRIVKTIAVDGRPSDVALGNGSVWIWNAAHTDPVAGITPARLVRIDGRYNDIVRAIPIESGHGLLRVNVAFGASAVWVADTEPPGTVWKIDPNTNKVVRKVDVGGPAPPRSSATASPGNAIGGPGLAVGEGSVWVLVGGGLARINPRTLSVRTIPLGSVSVPAAVAIGEGSVWVVSRPDFRCCPLVSIGTGTLSRIDPRTNSVDATRTLGGNSVGVAVGEGAVWVANAGLRTVARIDPRTNRVVAIKIGGRPVGVAVDGKAVWVAVG